MMGNFLSGRGSNRFSTKALLLHPVMILVYLVVAYIVLDLLFGYLFSKADKDKSFTHIRGKTKYF